MILSVAVEVCCLARVFPMGHTTAVCISAWCICRSIWTNKPPWADWNGMLSCTINHLNTSSSLVSHIFFRNGMLCLHTRCISDLIWALSRICKRKMSLPLSVFCFDKNWQTWLWVFFFCFSDCVILGQPN